MNGVTGFVSCRLKRLGVQPVPCVFRALEVFDGLAGPSDRVLRTLAGPGRIKRVVDDKVYFR